MAVFNGSRFVGEQLDSILNQTLPPTEVVIVDDGSTDGTIELIKNYAARYPQIKFFENARNIGVTSTFEKAVRASTGDFIALSDQDDIWLPEKLQVLVNEIGKYDVVYSNSMLIDENGRSLNKLFSSMMHLQSYTNGVPFLLSNTVAGHTMMLKKKFADLIVPFPVHLFFDLWIAFNAASRNGIMYVDKVLVMYRQHATNVVGTRLSANKKLKTSAGDEFDKKKKELETLAAADIEDIYTRTTLNELLTLFHHRLSLRRSAFFFRHFHNILAAKKKPYHRKVLYCLKMVFKPNY